MSQNVGTDAKKMMADNSLGVSTVHAILIKPGFAYDPDNHVYYSQVKDAWEVDELYGYLKGGKALTNYQCAKMTGKVEVTYDNINWPLTGTVSAIGVMFLIWTGVDATSLIWGYIEFEGGVRNEGADFPVNNIRLPIS